MDFTLFHKYKELKEVLMMFCLLPLGIINRIYMKSPQKTITTHPNDMFELLDLSHLNIPFRVRSKASNECFWTIDALSQMTNEIFLNKLASSLSDFILQTQLSLRINII